MSRRQTLAFVKMHGAGNDYIYVDGIRDPFDEAHGPACARHWSDRHFGIGGDGLIALLPPRDPTAAPVRMAMWNADGSRGAFCGNGLRCLAALAREHGHASRDDLRVESDVGVHAVDLLRDRDGLVHRARARLPGVAIAPNAVTLTIDRQDFEVHLGDAGNPHAVIVMSDPDAAGWPVVAVGQALQTHPRFPAGVNVSCIATLAPDRLRQRTFERGSGETLACGSAATVAATIASHRGLVRAARITVEVPGGELVVEPATSTEAAILEGPVTRVFEGAIAIDLARLGADRAEDAARG